MDCLLSHNLIGVEERWGGGMGDNRGRREREEREKENRGEGMGSKGREGLPFSVDIRVSQGAVCYWRDEVDWNLA